MSDRLVRTFRFPEGSDLAPRISGATGAIGGEINMASGLETKKSDLPAISIVDPLGAIA